MLENFKEFEIKNSKVIYGGDHGDNLGVPNDGIRRSIFPINIMMDHGDNDGIPPDGAKK